MKPSNGSVQFRTSLDFTAPQTYEFATIVGRNTPLDLMYEGAVIGFSMVLNNGTFGFRYLWFNPAGGRTNAYATVTNGGGVGFTGVGASAGLFNWAGIIGAGNTQFYGLKWPTPDLLEIAPAAAGVSGTVILGGKLWNPVNK